MFPLEHENIANQAEKAQIRRKFHLSCSRVIQYPYHPEDLGDVPDPSSRQNQKYPSGQKQRM
jgi:hypothetical protein